MKLEVLVSAKSYDEGSGSGCSLFARCECICLLCVSREHCSRSNTNKLLKTTVNSNQNYTHILWRLYLEILDRSCLLYLRTFGTHNRIRFEKPYPLYMLDVCFLLFFFSIYTHSKFLSRLHTAEWVFQCVEYSDRKNFVFFALEMMMMKEKWCAIGLCNSCSETRSERSTKMGENL